MNPNSDHSPENLPAKRQQKASLVATGGQATAIIPRSVEEMFRLADAIYGSGLAPKTLSSPQKVMVAIMAGAELGMPPFQSVQSFAVIGNRPAIWGDAIPALLWSNGFKIKEWFEGSDPSYPDEMTARCVVTRPDGTEIEREFAVGDAKEAKLWSKDGPWQTSRKRMLQMRARSFAARDGAADVLRGQKIAEEVQDYADDVKAVPSSGLRDHLPARNAETAAGFSVAAVDEALSPDDEIVEAEFEERADPSEGIPESPPPGVSEGGVGETGGGDVSSPAGQSPTEPESSSPPVDSEPSGTAPTQEHPAGQPSTASGAASSGNRPDGAGGGLPRSAATSKPSSLADAARAYGVRLRSAKDTTRLTAIRTANGPLREKLAEERPSLLVAVEELFNDLYRTLENPEEGGDE